MKKYLLIWWVWLLLTWILAYFLLSQDRFGFVSEWSKISNITSKVIDVFNLSESWVLNYIPKDFTQVIYISLDDRIQWLVTKTLEQKTIPSDIRAMLWKTSKIREIWAVQSGNVWYALVTAKDDVSPQDLIKELEAVAFFGTWLWDIEYRWEILNWRIFVYGSDESRNYIKNYSWETIAQNSDLKNYVSDVESWKINVAVFVKSDAKNVDLWSDYLSQYVWYMNYWVVVWSVSKDLIEWEGSVIYDKEFTIWKGYKFDPTLSKHFSDDNYIYIELWSILKLFGVDTTKVKPILLDIISNTHYGDIMSDEQLNKIIGVFEWNVWLKIWESSNMLGIWWELIFEKEEMFDILHTYFPILKQLITEAKITTWTILEIDEVNKYWFSVWIPYYSTEFVWDIYMIKQWGDAILSILWINPTEKWVTKEFHDDKTIFRLWMNFGKLMEWYKKIALMTQLPDDEEFINSMSFFTDKILQAYLTLWPTKISLKFKIQ